MMAEELSEEAYPEARGLCQWRLCGVGEGQMWMAM